MPKQDNGAGLAHTHGQSGKRQSPCRPVSQLSLSHSKTTTPNLVMAASMHNEQPCTAIRKGQSSALGIFPTAERVPQGSNTNEANMASLPDPPLEGEKSLRAVQGMKCQTHGAFGLTQVAAKPLQLLAAHTYAHISLPACCKSEFACRLKA